jgi:hypothetical protein
VEAPITDWLQEAYELSDVLNAKVEPSRKKSNPKPKRRSPHGKTKTHATNRTRRKR